MVENDFIKPGMRVAVMGYGISGRAAVRYLLECDADVSVSDARRLGELPDEHQEYLERNSISYEGGGHSSGFLKEAELIVVSPGIPKDLEVLREVRRKGIPVMGELALAGPAIHVPIVAITGTNGKTTVTSLIGELLQKAGKKVFVGGNIGTPLFDFLLGERDVDVVVLEVSSFQLENSGDFRPDVALLLNVTPDHLDWHGSLAAYTDAKARLFLHQGSRDTAIVCGDDPACSSVMERFPDSSPLIFGCGLGCDARIDGDHLEVTWQGECQIYDLTATSMANHIGRLNGASAILAVLSLGCRQETIEKGLGEFFPPPHRMERVLELSGVSYIDDSKATNTGAVLSALEQVEGKVVLIAGGRDKGDDYSLLREAVEGKVRKLILIGEAAGNIGKRLDDIVSVGYANSMDEAVLHASEVAGIGETVLLSPACASFDMFDSYGHRGDVFAAAVRRLKLKMY